MPDEPRVCPHCGIFYYEWLQQDWKAILTPGDPPCEPLIPNVHECPEPYTYEVAKLKVEMAAAMGGVVVSQTERARIRLGLEGRRQRAGGI